METKKKSAHKTGVPTSKAARFVDKDVKGGIGGGIQLLPPGDRGTGFSG